MRAEQVKGLMEAYSHVYETPEVLNEEVVEEDIEVLDEAPMTAFQAAGGNAKLAQLNKGRSPRAGRVTAASIEKQGQENLFKAGGGNAAIAKGPTRSQNVRGGGTRQVSTLTRQDIINKGTVAAAKPVTPDKPKVSNIPPAEGTGRGGPSDIRRGSTPTPSAPAAKPAAAAPKPTTPTTPAKPAGSAIDQWAKANPKLAAAKAERDRTRGTSATTNPLMKDMKSSMPAPKSPAPSTAKTGFDLAKKGVSLAAGADLFDIVKGHLLDEGYADSEEGAMVIMVNMSEEWRKSILEAHGVELQLSEVLDTPEKATEYGKKALGSMLGATAKALITKDKKYVKTVEKRTKGVEAAKRKAEKKAKEEQNEEYVNEAQRARENPEGHDKEEKKKYEPVRGERTPMPPRGDKRREDFEKWYAKQIGR